MTKTQEIIEKMKAGASPVDLIGQGYKRGLVYKVKKTLRSPSSVRGDLAPSSQCRAAAATPIGTVDSNIESDPEILELKKQLRKAELQRQLVEINAPIEIESRGTALEQKIAELENTIDWLFEGVIDLQTIINNPPLSELYRKYQCSCGANEVLATKVQCKACGKEYLCGPS